MTDKETLPLKAARKLNLLILQNEALAKNKSLQEKIIAWSLDMLEEARADWSDMHNAILDAVITCDRRKEAIKRGKREIINMLHLENILRNCKSKSLLNIKN